MSSLIKYPLLLTFPLLFSGCMSFFFGSNTQSYSDYEIDSSRVDRDGKINDSSAMHRATMKPYRINGKWYYPTTVNLGDRFDGIASWYGPNFHGKKTSNGEIYSMYKRTAAHKTLPMNTMVKVTNRENGKSTVVRINDRGPFVASRIIDLSNVAAREIDMVQKGTAPVSIEILGFKGTISTLVENNLKDTPTQPLLKDEISTLDGGSATTNDLGVIEEELSLAPTPVIAAPIVATPLPIATPKIQTPTLEPTASEEHEIKNSSGEVESYQISGFYVQIGAFKYRSGAEKFASTHKNKNYTVTIKSYATQEGTINRVLIGKFSSEDEARDFIEKEHFEGAFIFRESN